MESLGGDYSALQADVYFLIQRFLSAGPLKETLQVLNRELEANKILPRRLSWEGGEYERTLEDMERQFSHIRPDFLLQLCYEATKAGGGAVSSFLSGKPRLRQLGNFGQYFGCVSHLHGVPVGRRGAEFNSINSIRAREVSGPFHRNRFVSPRLYKNLQMQRITLGHLSAVYCLSFDNTGNFIITGADDLLIKLWSAHTGRLISALRGASSEITDITVNLNNTLLAAGSIDRVLRVWNLQTGAPVAVLAAHTGMITSVNFCPTPCWGLNYLISTSNDGSVAFWTYTTDSMGKAMFRLTPILYQEKVRPGQAQMVCSSFSPGGAFLATGSADHHVRIYYMCADDGPQRILENEAHQNRVESIQWAHSGLKLVSGGKDGLAIIWWFETQQWKSICLNMTEKLGSKKLVEDPKKVKVTMVCWDLSDYYVITAVSDHTLRVWKSYNGELERVLTGHTDEVYVLEAHPQEPFLILSAGHDGQLLVWDISKGEIITRYLNTIEGQGYGAVFDAKWSPDGCSIAATDSHGHLMIFGFGMGSLCFQQLPKELFFHTDYRPLVRDANLLVLDEQTQLAPHLMPPPFLVDSDGNPYPPTFQRLVPGREHCNVEQLIPNIVIGYEGTQEVIQDGMDQAGEPNNAQDMGRRIIRRNRENERIRQSTGDWQSDPNMEWERNVIVPSMRPSILRKAQERCDLIRETEIEEYLKQLRQRPHMICTANSSLSNKQREKEKKSKAKYQTRARQYQLRSNSEPSESSAHEDAEESSGYSDWMAEEGVNLEPPKRSKRRQVLHDSEEDDEEDEPKKTPSPPPPQELPRRQAAERVKSNLKEEDFDEEKLLPGPSGSPANGKIKNLEQYRFSEWLSETKPRKSPYYPQMGDEIVYLIQGHQLYLDMVKTRNIYAINHNDLAWNKMEIKDIEFVKVIGIQYEIKPPRLCCLRLAILDEEGKLTGQVFTVKYHDMPDVLDFFVLKQTYDTSVARNWSPQDKFRCMIDDEWWIGEIVDNSPASELYQNSPFMCFEIKWFNGERERMSPWDLEPIDPERMPEDESEALPVLDQELNAILYKPEDKDWANSTREQVRKFILAGLTSVMELAIAEPFLVPVDLVDYPSYALIIEYPIDLSMIKARFESNFYRRLTAAQFDIRYLATNAEKYNQRHSLIIKHARILTELCLRVVKNCSGFVDVGALYHQLLENYDSSDTEEDVEVMPSTSRLRSIPNSCFKRAKDWKLEAGNLIKAMWECEDSVPFRAPVNLLKYPDYDLIVRTPMDLGTVRDSLQKDQYDHPQDFGRDVRLIFQNSRTYNTNKRSRIHVMTVRLSAMFEEHMTKIIFNWKVAKRREAKKTNNKTSDDSSSSSSSSNSSSHSSLSVAEEEELDLEISMKDRIVKQESESDDDVPLNHFKLDSIKKRTSSSSESYKDQESSSDQSSTTPERKVLPRKRPARRKVNTSSKSTEEDDDDSDFVVNSKKKIKLESDSSEETEQDEEVTTTNPDGSVFTTVSSRGRVRKLTPRARALVNKDKL